MERFVHTRSGKARVNWYRKGQLGVTYVEIGDGIHDCNVLREDQVEFRYGTFPEDESKKDVRKEEYKTLADRLHALRRDRQESANTKRKETTKKKKEPRNPLDRLKKMSAEEKAILMEMLKGAEEA